MRSTFDIYKRRGLLDEAEREQLRQRLNEIPGVDSTPDAIGGFPLSALGTVEAMSRFQGIFAEVISRIHSQADGVQDEGDGISSHTDGFSSTEGITG